MSLHRTLRVCVATIATVMALAGQTADEHAKHHPAPAAGDNLAGNQPDAPSASPNPSAPAGMGAGMGEMMDQIGKPPRKELYPSLMVLPDEVTQEQRAGIEQLAEGIELPSEARGRSHPHGRRSGPAQVNQCYRCHQTTSWNDIRGAGYYKHH